MASTLAQGSSRGSWNMTRATSRRLPGRSPNGDAACVGRVEAGEQAQQRALAAAAAADDGDELPGRHMEVEAAQHRLAPNVLARPRAATDAPALALGSVGSTSARP